MDRELANMIWNMCEDFAANKIFYKNERKKPPKVYIEIYVYVRCYLSNHAMKIINTFPLHFFCPQVL